LFKYRKKVWAKRASIDFDIILACDNVLRIGFPLWKSHHLTAERCSAVCILNMAEPSIFEHKTSWPFH